MKPLPLIPGERAWKAADRACGADGIEGSAHFEHIRQAAGSGQWAEIDEEAQWEALECMPPIYFPGGFAVSEAVCNDKDGRTLYLCIVHAKDRYFACYESPRAVSRKALIAALESEERTG